MTGATFDNLRVFEDCPSACHESALYLENYVADIIARNGQCRLAVSGGTTPWPMLSSFFRCGLPWQSVELFQTDERMAPEHSPDRNATHLIPLLPPGIHFHPMPYDTGGFPEEQAVAYEKELEAHCGTPPILDLVHLGLGPDGHTASLTLGDPVLDLVDRQVASTRPYRGRIRLTLTVQTIRTAKTRLWLACGPDKRQALDRCFRQDSTLPASRVYRPSDPFFCDRLAAPDPGVTIRGPGSGIPPGS
jgi:6-phosphogluconolactonase/glucosamine-6-phosphate isomerase/deaminase